MEYGRECRKYNDGKEKKMKQRFACFLTTLLLLSGSVSSVALEPQAVISCDFQEKGALLPSVKGSEKSILLQPGKNVKAQAGPDGIPGIVFQKGEKPFLSAAEGGKVPDMSESSGSFRIRFDEFGEASKTPESVSMGVLDCVLEKDGHIVLRFYGGKDDLRGPYITMRSKDRFEKGKWYHIAWNYSMNKQRLSFYVDGVWQYENDNATILLPKVSSPVRFTPRFNGALAAYRLYEASLDSSWLTPQQKAPAEKEVLKNLLSEAGKYTANPSFTKYLNELGKRLESYSGRKDVTEGQWNALEQKIRNAQRMAAEMPNASNKASCSGPVAVYTVPPISQEIRTPWKLPADGTLSGVLEIFAAQGEYESASFLVIPFQALEKFHVTASALKGPGGAEIPASALDLKLVKRWYRAGGAWLNYHADRRGRFLTPDLLLNDDSLVRVDEIRRTNEIRLDYPEGSVYFDASRRESTSISSFDPDLLPFRDAPQLLPLTLPEAGKNQQYWLTLHVPENTPGGLYRGTLSMTADGKSVGTLALSVRVFPFQLPEARTSYDTSRRFFGNFSHGMAIQNQKTSEDRLRAEFKIMKEHNMLYPTGAFMPNKEMFEKEVRVRKSLGMPLRPIFAGSSTSQSWNRTKPEERTTEVFEKEMSDYGEEVEEFLARHEKAYGHRDVYMYGIDEASSYNSLYYLQEPTWTVVKRHGGKIRVTGMGINNLDFVGDIQDMIVRTAVEKDEAEHWHAGGALIMNYARPFPGAENPLIFRRRVGMWMYMNNYDGSMIHGFAARRRFNEFFDDRDGNYRNFAMTYPTSDGVINTIALEGLREAFDDIRYVSLGKILAEKARESGVEELVREGRRQLIWFSRISPDRGDLDYVRLSAAHRICILLDLYKKHGVKLP